MARAHRPGTDRGSRTVERHCSPRPALIVYFDTSAFVKLLVPERGAAQAVETWLAAERRVSSLLLYAEARAAVGRAIRMQRIVAGQVERTAARLERFWDALDRVAVTERLSRRAGELAEAVALRGYGAVQLASLESVGADGAHLVSADAELLAAAQALGFATVPLQAE